MRAQQKTRRALDAVQTAFCHRPDDAPLHYELALIRCDRNEAREAIESLRRCLELDPATRNGWLVLGDLLYARSDAAGADRAYLQHVDRAAASDYIVDAMTALRREDYRHAEIVLRRQLARLPTDLAALAVLGETLGRIGKSEEAAWVLGQCIARVPSFDSVRANYAAILCRLGRRSRTGNPRIAGVLRRRIRPGVPDVLRQPAPGPALDVYPAAPSALSRTTP